MHPAVGAAPQQHSNFFDYPWDRLVRSVPQIPGMIYDADNQAQAERVRDYHKPLEGIDSRGERYHAPNPHVYWTWPLLPDRLRYMPRAYAGVARERGA